MESHAEALLNFKTKYKAVKKNWRERKKKENTRIYDFFVCSLYAEKANAICKLAILLICSLPSSRRGFDA